MTEGLVHSLTGPQPNLSTAHESGGAEIRAKKKDEKAKLIKEQKTKARVCNRGKSCSPGGYI